VRVLVLSMVRLGFPALFAVALTLAPACSIGSSPADEYRKDANAICRDAHGQEAVGRLRSLQVPGDLADKHRAFVEAVAQVAQLGPRVEAASLEHQRLLGVRKLAAASRQGRRLRALQRELSHALARVESSGMALDLNDCTRARES
jgi:hypothetical protein